MPKPKAESLSETKRRLYKLALAHKDISSAELTCAAYLRMVESTPKALPYEITYAFLLAVVTSYARPFVDNKSTGVLPKRWSEFPKRRLQGVHHAMLKARNEIYAHSDSSIAPLKVFPEGVAIPEVKQISKRTSWIIGSYEFPSGAAVPFYECCSDLKERMQVELLSLIEQVLEQTGRSQAIDITW